MKFVSLEENTKHAVSLEQFNDICKNSHVIVMYYANWCGWSKKLRPEWDKLLKTLQTKYTGNFVMAEVDSDSMRNLPQEFDHNVRGFPTTLYLVNGERKSELGGGGHSADDFEKWLASDNVLGDKLIVKTAVRSPPPRVPQPKINEAVAKKSQPTVANPHNSRQFVNNRRRFKLGWNR